MCCVLNYFTKAYLNGYLYFFYSEDGYVSQNDVIFVNNLGFFLLCWGKKIQRNLDTI